MQTPAPRGPLSAHVLAHLTSGGTTAVPLDELTALVAAIDDPFSDGDLNLALACCYELHYRGFDDVDDDLEWDPPLLAARRVLEDAFERGLVDLVGAPDPLEPDDVGRELHRLVEAPATAPSLSSFLLRDATADHYRDLLRQRSVYHLKEADPHTFAIPRLHGAAKSALVEIQADEYGGGVPHRMHSVMFADTMRALGLDDTYGAYWDVALPETLAAVNLMSMFGLHRRLRGALLGQLAVLEMDSTVPNRRYGNGLRRLGYGQDATAFFDEHVEADAVHEQLAVTDMCGSFVADEPDQAAFIVWGAACSLALDARAVRALTQGWTAGPRTEVA